MFKDPINRLVVSEFLGVIFLNWFLFSFFAVSAVYFFVFERKINFAVVAGIIYIFAMLFIKRLYGYYFIPIIPFIAISCSVFAEKIIRKINKKTLAIVLVIVCLIFLWDVCANALFIRNEGFVSFGRLDDITEYINSNFDESYELFGDDSMVALLALKTGKKIALNHFETNDGVFESGIVDLNVLLENISKKNVIFVVRSKQGISKFESARNFLYEKCEFMSQFNDKVEKETLIYRCDSKI